MIDITKLRQEDPAAFNILVAKKVMGMKPVDFWLGGQPVLSTPDYAASPDADYAVLKYVRETWLIHSEEWCNFVQALHALAGGAAHYTPGDWSEAALRVVLEKENHAGNSEI
jgi:hypothetical protein